MMATISSARGVHLSDELQVLGCRRLLVALVFLASTLVNVQCITANALAPASQAPDPTLQNFTIFKQYEANALNAIRLNWTQRTPQLSSVLNWTSSSRHPCNISASMIDFSNNTKYQGAWRGVFCTVIFQDWNATGNYYDVSVTTLKLFGSNPSCDSGTSNLQCGFEGIKGVLPSAISKLTNLVTLDIEHNPELTGPVPLEIWQMPHLMTIYLSNNSLGGTLPASNDFIPSSKLRGIYLNNNNFSGTLEVSSQGTLFSSNLMTLDLSFNQLDGPVDFQGLNANASNSLSYLYLNNNGFNGTFSTGPYFDPIKLFLYNNAFTGIKFVNYTGHHGSKGSGTIYMPRLQTLDASDNQFSGPIPADILSMPSLYALYLSGNYLSGTFPAEVLAMPQLWNLDVSRNNFSGSMDFRGFDTLIDFTTLNVSTNNFNGTYFPGQKINIEELDLSNNYFNNINYEFYNGTNITYMPGLKELYIRNNNLSVKFPSLISKAPNLQILNIENNKLSGKFPDPILKGPILRALYAGKNEYNTLQLPDITFENFSWAGVYLTNNNINYVQYPSSPGPFSKSNLQFSNYLFLGGNPFCQKIDNMLLSTICRMNRSEILSFNVEQKLSTKNKVIIGTSTITFGLILLITTLYVWRLMSRIRALRIILREFEKKEVKPNLYSYKDIKLATKNFDKKNTLGEGGFGIVYKGELSDGTIVAVKKLTMSSSQMLSEFLNEVVVISGLKHRNLVKLKGCCLGDGDQRMLVFEYVENKNLAEALSFSGDLIENYEPPYLDWATRFKIIEGTARGLAYLHEDLQSPIIHRDIKATNILLDKDYYPKIADFGLAYLFPTLKNEESHLTLMQVAGTRGYCSPEYALQGHISTALDVYSFGIVILEIISGRKNIDRQKVGEEIYLLEWAWKQFEAHESTALIDSRMRHSFSDAEAIMRVISVALACVQYKAAKRPKMHDVVPMLLGNMPISNFCRESMHEEVLEGVASSSSIIRSNTTSSFWKNGNPCIDEYSLLSDVHEIETNARS